MINSDKIIGIMGGTFNPIHKGHTGIARCAYEQSDIDEILFMPSGTPAYKDNSPIVSATDRCNMVKLAIKPFDYMSLSTIETDRPGNTYTADTLAQIYDSYKKIYFIIGADSLLYIQDWYHPEYICSHCHLLCANRDNNSASVLIDQKHFLADKYGADILEREEFDGLIKSLKKFVEHESWESIALDDGLEYKKYTPKNDEKNWFRGLKYSGQTIMKFRFSSKMRCFGYRKENKFMVLRLERDHSISENG